MKISVKASSVALMIAADRVAGGVVAFQLGINFYSLAIAIGATASGGVYVGHPDKASEYEERLRALAKRLGDARSISGPTPRRDPPPAVAPHPAPTFGD